MASKNEIKPALENVVSGMKVKQQQQPATAPATDGDGDENEEENQVGNSKPQKFLPPQATPNMNAEAAQAAAVQFKKREKSIRKACAKLDGNAPEQKACCVIL